MKRTRGKRLSLRVDRDIYVWLQEVAALAGMKVEGVVSVLLATAVIRARAEAERLNGPV